MKISLTKYSMTADPGTVKVDTATVKRPQKVDLELGLTARHYHDADNLGTINVEDNSASDSSHVTVSDDSSSSDVILRQITEQIGVPELPHTTCGNSSTNSFKPDPTVCSGSAARNENVDNELSSPNNSCRETDKGPYQNQSPDMQYICSSIDSQNLRKRNVGMLAEVTSEENKFLCESDKADIQQDCCIVSDLTLSYDNQTECVNVDNLLNANSSTDLESDNSTCAGHVCMDESSVDINSLYTGTEEAILQSAETVLTYMQQKLAQMDAIIGVKALVPSRRKKMKKGKGICSLHSTIKMGKKRRKNMRKKILRLKKTLKEVQQSSTRLRTIPLSPSQKLEYEQIFAHYYSEKAHILKQLSVVAGQIESVREKYAEAQGSQLRTHIFDQELIIFLRTEKQLQNRLKDTEHSFKCALEKFSEVPGINTFNSLREISQTLACWRKIKLDKVIQTSGKSLEGDLDEKGVIVVSESDSDDNDLVFVGNDEALIPLDSESTLVTLNATDSERTFRHLSERVKLKMSTKAGDRNLNFINKMAKDRKMISQVDQSHFLLKPLAHILLNRQRQRKSSATSVKPLHTDNLHYNSVFGCPSAPCGQPVVGLSGKKSPHLQLGLLENSMQLGQQQQQHCVQQPGYLSTPSESRRLSSQDQHHQPLLQNPTPSVSGAFQSSRPCVQGSNSGVTPSVTDLANHEDVKNCYDTDSCHFVADLAKFLKVTPTQRQDRKRSSKIHYLRNIVHSCIQEERKEKPSVCKQ